MSENLTDKDKRLEFEIGLKTKNNLIIKDLYNRMGEWEQRLKSFE